jgi:hypothetical protein
MTGKGIAVALGLGAFGTLALITGRKPSRARGADAPVVPPPAPRPDPVFDRPMVPPPPGPPREHAASLTPISAAEARDWLAWAYSAETAQVIPPPALAMLLAHSALETGEWAKMRGFNFGNITALGRDRPYYILRGVAEFVQGKPVKMDMAFRWYPAAALGAWDFVRVLRRQFAAAWGLLESRDPTAYTNALADAGYFTAPRERYALGMSKRYADFVQRELGRPSA